MPDPKQLAALRALQLGRGTKAPATVIPDIPKDPTPGPNMGEFVPVGGEEAYNVTRPVSRPSDPMESVYKSIMSTMGRPRQELQGGGSSPMNMLLQMGRRNIPQPDPEQLALRDEQALEAQSQWPAWKQSAHQAINAPIDFAKGFIGMGRGSPGLSAENLGELVGSAPANPFRAMKMAAGPRIKGFILPDNKVLQPDVEGVNRIVGGDQALRAIKKLTTPKSIADVPSVRSQKELPDVAVPIQDSLDTDMAAGAPLVGKMHERNAASGISRSKLTPDEVWKIRELGDRGWNSVEIRDYLGKSNAATIQEIKNRIAYRWVAENPTIKKD